MGPVAETEDVGRTYLFSVIVPTFMSVRHKCSGQFYFEEVKKSCV